MSRKVHNRRIFFYITFALIALILTLGIFKLKDYYTSIFHRNSEVEINKNTIYNIALFGYGGGNHDGTYLTDSIMIIHLDTVKKKVLLVSIPRDLWVMIPTTSGTPLETKINALYEMGLYPNLYPAVDPLMFDKNDPASLSKRLLSQITGLPIQNYVAVDFDGFKKVIDTLGGIDVTVDKTFDDYEYPIDGKEKDLCGTDAQFIQIQKYLTPPVDMSEKEQFLKDKPDLAQFLDDIANDPAHAFPCRYEHLHFDKGLTHMNGETALKYARSRHSLQDGTDFGRAARQQKVILAVKEKVLSLSFIPKILPLLDTFKNDIDTDLPPTDIKNMLFETPNNKEYSIKTFVISNDNYLQISTSSDNQSILIPQAGMFNWNQIKAAIQNELSDKIATPSPHITPKK